MSLESFVDMSFRSIEVTVLDFILASHKCALAAMGVNSPVPGTVVSLMIWCWKDAAALISPSCSRRDANVTRMDKSVDPPITALL